MGAYAKVDCGREFLLGGGGKYLAEKTEIFEGRKVVAKWNQGTSRSKRQAVFAQRVALAERQVVALARLGGYSKVYPAT